MAEGQEFGVREAAAEGEGEDERANLSGLRIAPSSKEQKFPGICLNSTIAFAEPFSKSASLVNYCPARSWLVLTAR